jgi:hypothetical protein
LLKRDFQCGPLKATVITDDSGLFDKVARFLELYDVVWPPPLSAVWITVTQTDSRAAMVQGNYLSCWRMNVDAASSGLYATCTSGVSGSCSLDSEHWSISVPRNNTPEWEILADLDQLVDLTLTKSWRRLGWVPVHAGAVEKDGCCVILAAPAGAGKTTLVTSMIRRDWRTLGDDKLLIRIGDDGSEIAGLVHSINLHPNTQKWLPEVSDFEAFPQHSFFAFNQKRRVRIEDIWPGRCTLSAKPTHVAEIVRRDDHSDFRISSIGGRDTFSTLLRYTVIPNNPFEAHQIMSTVAETTKQLKGFRIEIGNNAYESSDGLSQLETVFQ